MRDGSGISRIAARSRRDDRPGIKEVEVLYGPLAREGFHCCRSTPNEELAAVLRYLEDGQQLQRAHAQRIRALGNSGFRQFAPNRVDDRRERIDGTLRRRSDLGTGESQPTVAATGA